MEAIFHIGIAQSVFAALILFARRSKTLPDKILGIWMLFIAAELLNMLLDHQNNPLHQYTSNFSFYSLTFGPFLYLYIDKLLDDNPIFTWKDSTHFYAYIILVFIHLVFFTNQQITSGNLNENDPFYILYFIRALFLIFSLVIYGTLVMWLVKRHQKKMTLVYSFESPKITLSWVHYIAIIFILSYIVYAIIFLLYIMNAEFISSLYAIPGVGLTLISFMVSYFGSRQPELYILSESEPDDFLSRLTESDTKALATRISNYMENEKPYLNPELTLDDLSGKLDMPVSHVSQIINGQLDRNFYSYINQYRVEEAKNRLTDPQFENKTVLKIGYDSGFNSRNAFNMLFEKYAGMSPAQYRQKYYMG